MASLNDSCGSSARILPKTSLSCILDVWGGCMWGCVCRRQGGLPDSISRPHLLHTIPKPMPVPTFISDGGEMQSPSPPPSPSHDPQAQSRAPRLGLAEGAGCIQRPVLGGGSEPVYRNHNCGGWPPPRCTPSPTLPRLPSLTACVHTWVVSMCVVVGLASGWV